MGKGKHNPKNHPKDFAYYVTLFTLEGHESWRVHVGSHKQGFDEERSKWANAPKVTEKKVHRIDRLTSEMVEQ